MKKAAFYTISFLLALTFLLSFTAFAQEDPLVRIRFGEYQKGDTGWKALADEVDNLFLDPMDAAGDDDQKLMTLCTENKGDDLKKSGFIVLKVNAPSGKKFQSLDISFSGRAINPAPQSGDPNMNVSASVKILVSTDNKATWKLLSEVKDTDGSLAAHSAAADIAGKNTAFVKFELTGGNATFGKSWACIRTLIITPVYAAGTANTSSGASSGKSQNSQSVSNSPASEASQASADSGGSASLTESRAADSASSAESSAPAASADTPANRNALWLALILAAAAVALGGIGFAAYYFVFKKQ